MENVGAEFARIAMLYADFDRLLIILFKTCVFHVILMYVFEDLTYFHVVACCEPFHKIFLGSGSLWAGEGLTRQYFVMFSIVFLQYLSFSFGSHSF